MTGRLSPGVSLAGFGFAVEAWHRANFTDEVPSDLRAANRVLGVAKVTEEAGELVGALTKYVEGRGAPEAMLDELGDVVIAAAGALRRINDLLGTDYAFADVVLARWEVVSARMYGDDEPPTPKRPLRLLVFVGPEQEAHAQAVHALDRFHGNVLHAIPPGLATRVDALTLVVDGQEVRAVPVSTMDEAHRLGGAILSPGDVYAFTGADPDVEAYVVARIRTPRP